MRAKKRYYPVSNPKRLEVDSEEFSENYASLASIEGVRLVTKFVCSSAKKYQLNEMKTELVPKI